jgi:CHAT domain-containing protein
LLVTYAPNAAFLQQAVSRARSFGDLDLLVVDDPSPVSESPLPGAQHEAAAAVAAFRPRAVRLRGKDANRRAIATALPGATVIHVASHRATDLQHPLDGGLLLAGDDVLRVRDLLQLGVSSRLAILSACDTGVPGLDLPDEVVGLATAFLQAGAAAVIASMWPVPDAATMLLVVRFYDCWRREGLKPAQALRRAQCWLRDTPSGQVREWFEALLAQPDSWLPSATAMACLEAVLLNDPHEHHVRPAGGLGRVHQLRRLGRVSEVAVAAGCEVGVTLG